MTYNAFYAHSGGVTAVLNATASGLITRAHQTDSINKVLIGRFGLIGALYENFIDSTTLSEHDILALKHTPGSAFGSCRYKLSDSDHNRKDYQRLIEVFAQHNIRYFFYNGGGDSQDTVYKMAQMSAQMNYPLACLGIPKTIDNDLIGTDTCPGFGSTAKYIATSVRETALDVASMCETSTKVFILEVMGRHTGWIAASAGLAARYPGDAPHVLLFPEVPFKQELFLKQVHKAVVEHGFCVVVVSEGVCDLSGELIIKSTEQDAFGHSQLGGVAPFLAQMVHQHLGHKNHWAVADYLQRSARHLASQTDVDQAYALGQAAIDYAVNGQNNIMLTLVREQDEPYRWSVGSIPLANVANAERKLPAEYISENGMHITEACRRYLTPLIVGEAYPPYGQDGLPDYLQDIK